MSCVHAIILTLNEAQHLERCILSLRGDCQSVTVVDSGSSDETVMIARRLGANVLVNPWVNYSSQLNFAIDNLADRGGWLLRVDADEILDPASAESINDAIRRAAPGTDGFVVQRRIHFLGRRMRHGAVEPSWQLRLFRNGRGRCEQRWMDEHILVVGSVEKSKLIFSDINLNSLSWWTAKHNSYASREAIDALNAKHKFMAFDDGRNEGGSLQAKARRFAKDHMYRRIPSGMRAWIYFVYRYFLRLGFLDGKEGFYFHALQGLWYRTLVDAKIHEIEKFAKSENLSILEAIRARIGIDPLA